MGWEDWEGWVNGQVMENDWWRDLTIGESDWSCEELRETYICDTCIIGGTSNDKPKRIEVWDSKKPIDWLGKVESSWWVRDENEFILFEQTEKKIEKNIFTVYFYRKMCLHGRPHAC